MKEEMDFKELELMERLYNVEIEEDLGKLIKALQEARDAEREAEKITRELEEDLENAMNLYE